MTDYERWWADGEMSAWEPPADEPHTAPDVEATLWAFVLVGGIGAAIFAAVGWVLP